MKTASVKKGLVRVGGLCALAGVTVLLTLLFSFLGTFTCAVIAGLILGSGRRWQWDSIPVSLVFPAVILSLSHFSKVDLPPGKVQLVALVSGGAFWAVLGLAFSFRFLERNGEPPPPAEVGVVRTSGTEAGSPPALDLASLRGSWTCEESRADGTGICRTLQIEAGRFVLTESKSRSRERVVARGEVSVDQTGAGKIVFISDPAVKLDR